MISRRPILAFLTWLSVGLGPARVWAAGTRPVAPGFRRIHGDVRINGEPAHIGRVVLPGDVITTGEGAEAIYVMGRDAFLLRERSEVGHFAEGAVWVLRVVQGKLLSVFGPGEKSLQTPSATIGIRGTGCYLEADPDQTYFCLCYGKAEVVPVADPSLAIRLQATYHDKPIMVSRESGQAMVSTAMVKGHRDEELIELEALVGRRPPFMNASYTPRY